MVALPELSNSRQFVVYRLVPRENGKSDKIPVDPLTGEPADAQDPAGWMLPSEAELWAASWGPGYGVGIVIHAGSHLFALDLDQCREVSGGWQPHAAHFMARFPAAYQEASVSGNGVHVIGSYHGEIPDHRTRNAEFRMELYTEARFIALGEPLGGSPLADCTEALLEVLAAYFPPREPEGAAEWTSGPVEAWDGPTDDADLIARARRSTSAAAVFGKGATFAALWDADADALGRAFPPQSAGSAWDGSAADLALANHLAFYTGNDCERMARLMRQSRLVRPKWDREDYFRGTILRACASQKKWYSAGAAPFQKPQHQPPLAPVSPRGESKAAPEAVTGEFTAVPPPPPPPPAADSGTAVEPRSFSPTVNAKGFAEASLPNLVGLLGTQKDWRLGFDEFRGRVMICRADEPENWRPVTDTDQVAIRENLERVQRFAPISKDLLRDALQLVAERFRFDSAITWLSAQVWDGTPRVERFMHDYCGTTLDEYTVAVSRYIWTGLAARIYEPGCQLDMVPALVSRQQGLYKSSALREMVPDPDWFTDGLDLHRDDDNFKRMLKGKAVCEIAELAGLGSASVEHIKRTITRRFEEWIEKWQTLPTKFGRRCMLFATTNNEQFLPLDETGQRRWLPLDITRIDRDAISRDRVQLWAEGAAVYQARKARGLPGVEFEAAERLARGRHARHEQMDVWDSTIVAWLSTPVPGPHGTPLPPPETRPFTVAEVLAGALLMDKDRMDAKAEKRVARLLRQLGFDCRSIRVDGHMAKRWVKI